MSPLSDAIRLASEGLPVFACEPRGKRPLAAAAPNGCHSATTDLDIVKDVWGRFPTANVGVATGNGILVLDVDGDEGILTLSELAPLPRTRSVSTGNGRHFYFRADGVDLRNTARKLGPGLDTRGTGGYVIAAGVHPSGNEYQSDDIPIANAPPWLVAALITPPERPRSDPAEMILRASDETTPYGRAALQNEALRVADAPKGTRNHTLNAAALKLGHLESGGEIAYGDVERVLEDAAAEAGLPAGEARATIKSGLEAGRAEPRTAPTRLEVVPPRQKTEPVDEGEEAPPSRLHVQSWSEFRDQSPEEITYLVQGLVPEGSLVFLAGAPKAGKTWIGIALAISVATGRPFLGRFPIPHEANVLYFALEGHKAAIRARIGSITRGTGSNPENAHDLANLAITYRPIGLDLSDGTWAHDVIQACDERNVRLVIIDVLRAAAPRLRESGEGAGDFAGIRAGLAPLLAQGITICLLHHFIKAGEASKGRTIGERMSGSGALFGHADLVIGITGKDPMNMRVELVGRDGATPDPFGVVLEGHGTSEFGGFGFRDTLLMRATDDVPGESGPWEHAQKVAEFIRRAGESVTPGQIKDEFGFAAQTLRDHISDLEKLGIRYVNKGRFSTYHAHSTDSTG